MKTLKKAAWLILFFVAMATAGLILIIAKISIKRHGLPEGSPGR